MSEQMKNRILDAVETLLKSSGHTGITMDATAAAAGVSRKTVYNHFANRYVLMDSAIARSLTRVVASLEGITGDTSMDFITKLNAVTSFGFEYMQSGRKTYFRNLSGFDVDTQDIYGEIRAKLLGFIGGIAREAAGEGILQPGIDTGKLTYVLMNIVEGLVFPDEREDDPYSRLEILKESLRTLLCGILTPRGSDALRDSPIFSP